MPGDANRFLGKVYCAIDCFLYLKVYLVPGSCKVVYYHFLPLSPPSLLCSATFRRQRGTWIVKPTTLSRGRGISLINHVRYY